MIHFHVVNLSSCNRQWRTRKVGNCGALQLEAAWRRASRFGPFLPGWHRVQFSDRLRYGTPLLSIIYRHPLLQRYGV